MQESNQKIDCKGFLEQWMGINNNIPPKNFFYSIDLELSRRCNLKCIYCATNAGVACEDELSYTELTNIIDQARACGAVQIVLVGGGEPLCYPHLKDIIIYITSRDMRCILVTNATLIDKTWAVFLYEHSVRLVIKLHAINSMGIHDFLVGKKGSFCKTMNAIMLLRGIGYSSNKTMPLVIENILCSYNREEIIPLWKWVRKQGMVPFFEIVNYLGRAQKEKQLFLNKFDLHDIFRLLSLVDLEYGFEWDPIPPIAGSICQRQYYSCYVTSSGNVRLCMGIDKSIGSVRKNKLCDIMKNSTLFKHMRLGREKLKGYCKVCTVHDSCYGCRGHAFARTGDPFADYTMCWHSQ
jgi:radical SAM protein with 4Fe4S-binding SPASM domain